MKTFTTVSNARRATAKMTVGYEAFIASVDTVKEADGHRCVVSVKHGTPREVVAYFIAKGVELKRLESVVTRIVPHVVTENNACQTAEGEAKVNVSNNQTLDKEETMTENTAQVDEAAAVAAAATEARRAELNEAKAAAEAKVAELSEAAATNKAAVAAATEEAKTAAGEHKKAVAYNKSLADDAAEKAQAVETENGWAAHVAHTKEVLAAVKADAATLKSSISEAKAAGKAVNAELKELGKAPKAKAAPVARGIPAETILVRTAVEAPKGVMGAVVNSFDGVKNYTQGLADAVEAVTALLAEKTLVSERWSNDREAHVVGYVRGGIRLGYLTEVKAA